MGEGKTVFNYSPNSKQKKENTQIVTRNHQYYGVYSNLCNKALTHGIKYVQNWWLNIHKNESEQYKK
jgi:hypothetical protein